MVSYHVRAGLGLWELDVDAAAVVHDRLDDFASGPDDGVVDVGGNLDLDAHHVGLLLLDLLDFVSGLLHISLPASDGDHVRVGASLRQIDFGAVGEHES